MTDQTSNHPGSPYPKWHHKVWAILLGSLVLVGLNLWINPKKYARSVEVQTIQKKDMQLKILATGLLGFKDFLEIKSELSEAIVKKNVSEGDKVLAGDVLLVLNSSKQKIAYEKEVDRIRDLKDDFAKAQKEYAIEKELFAKQAVARSNVEKAESDLAKAKTSYNLGKEELLVQQKDLQKTLVLSERSGIVLVDHVQHKTSVEQDKTLFEIGTPGQFQLNSKVDELNIQNVFVGAKADIQVDAFPNIVLSGIVSKINAEAESGNFSKLGVTIDIQDTKGLDLKSNLTSQAYIYGNEIKGAVWLPTESVKSEGDSRYVYVVRFNNRVKKQIIETGRIANNQVEIIKGLDLGEKVAVTSTDFLKDNEYIKFSEPKSE